MEHTNSEIYERDVGEFTKGLRPNSVRYPNGRLVHYTYGSSGSAADVLGRLDAIKDDNGGSPNNTLATYSWLGLGTMVIEDFWQPDVKLDYYGGTVGTYAGFDRFGRVVQHLWRDYSASADRDKYTYGHDRAGNRTYRELTTSSAKDEYYTYDGINRLTNFDRGDLNVGKTAISGTPAREEDFTLDPTGNWSGYLEKTSGSADLNQDRTHNKANEISTLTTWIDPVHDRAGNMTTVPKPSDPANGLTCKYDAWNRLVEVKDGETVVAKYEYDGLNRRVKKHVDPDGMASYEHFFYNAGWQILETRNTTTENDHPEGLQPKYQYVWSPRYIDSAILRDENTDQDGLCDDERIYYLTDANFNVTCLVDTAGDAIERYLYNPYGKVTIYTGDWSSTRSSSSYNNPILYTGRELDAETGLMYYRRRYYHSGLGRFVSRDPLAHEGGMNTYQYVGDSPLVATDPHGLVPISCECLIPWQPYRDPVDVTTNCTSLARTCCDQACEEDGLSWTGKWDVAGAGPSTSAAPLCERVPWETLTGLDCIACCMEQNNIDAKIQITIAGTGIALRPPVPKAVVLPGQSTTTNLWVRGCIRGGASKNVTLGVRVAGKLGVAILVVEGGYDCCLIGYCMKQCLSKS